MRVLESSGTIETGFYHSRGWFRPLQVILAVVAFNVRPTSCDRLMADITAEKLAQRAFDVGLLDAYQMDAVWGELGTHEVPPEAFSNAAIRKGFLTNFQIERLTNGAVDGYFYGNYKLLYIVGTGTFARVYRAVHKDSKRVVAVKVLRHRYMADEATRENFLREARMVMPLRHPNVVPIYEVTADRGRPYMVMEFIEGSNLRLFVQARKKLGLLDSLRLMTDIVAGLEYAAGAGVSHRDLKLSNVLVSSTGRAKLVDFGLAAMEATGVEDGKSFNPRSIDYAGLERVTGVRRNDPRSDIYFAGCMLYHMLTGIPPLAETRDRTARLSTQRFRDVKPITHLEPNLPLFVAQLVHKAMELAPERRHQTNTDLLADLKIGVRRVEKGETEAGRELAPEQAAALVEADDIGNEGQSRTVMLVESNIEMQNLLRERLKRRGYRVLVIGDVERALSRFDGVQHIADCAVFSTAELGQTALDGFNRFGQSENTRHIPAVMLVDKKQREMIQAASTGDHRKLLALPLKVRELRVMLKSLLT